MLFIQLISFIGILLAFAGSFYLSTRVFDRIKSLQEITGTKVNTQLREIANSYENEKNNSESVKKIIEFLNLMFIDFEAAQIDTAHRSRIGMYFLIAGTLFQALALFFALVSS